MADIGMSEMNNVYLVEPKDFDQDPRYEIKTGEALDRRISVHCVIQPAKIPGIKTHSLVIAHHPLGAGNGGWDSYDENLTVVDGLNISKKQLFDHAHQYAEKLSAKLGYTYFDLGKVKKIQEAERKVRDARSNLEALTS